MTNPYNDDIAPQTTTPTTAGEPLTVEWVEYGVEDYADIVESNTAYMKRNCNV